MTSASDEPLHVQVARALGWTDFKREGGILLPNTDNWSGWPPHIYPIIGQPLPRAAVPRYDDANQGGWAHTGPLIEKYRLDLMWVETYEYPSGIWEALCQPGIVCIDAAQAPTPLIAVCHLLLKLAAEGKLAA